MSYRIRLKDRAMWDLGIHFIAFNDEPLDLNYQNILGYTTVILMSETFQVSTEKVARAVLKTRRVNYRKTTGRITSEKGQKQTLDRQTWKID